MNDESSRLAETSKQRFFYGYIVVAAGFFIWLIGFGIYGTYGVFFKPLIIEFGWSRADTALGYSLGILGMAVFTIATGWLTDRLGPRIVVIFFGSFLGFSFLFLSQISAVWQFQLIYGLLTAIGLSTTTVPIMATTARWFAKRRGLMTGIVQAGLGIGGLIFSPLTGWLIVGYGWRHAYVVLGIIALAGITISGLFLRRDPHNTGQLPDGASEHTPPLPTSHPSSLQDGGLSVLGAIHTKAFWIVAGLYFGFGFLRSTFLAHTAAHVQDIGFSLSDGANIIAVISVSSIFGRIGMGRVADLLGVRTAFMISFAVTAVALVWGLMSIDLWGLYLFAFIFGFGWGAQAVLRFAITTDTFGLASIGLLMGILGIAEAVASALGAYYAGHIFDIIGNYRPAFWTGIVISITGVALAGLLKTAVSRD
jgi:MFS family permease